MYKAIFWCKVLTMAKTKARGEGINNRLLFENLKVLKELYGGTIASFSRHIDIRDSTVRSWFDKGCRPNADALYNIGKKCEVSLDWLVCGLGNQDRSKNERDQKMLDEFSKTILGPTSSRKKSRVDFFCKVISKSKELVDVTEEKFDKIISD